MLCRIVLKACIFLCCPLISIPSVAEVVSFDSSALSTRSLSELLSQRVTGSTLTEESYLRVPSAVTVFSRVELQQLGVRSLGELINFVPGFQSARNSDDAYSQTISARGRSTGNSSSEVLLIVNGQRYMDMRRAGISPFYNLPLAGVKRVEFIRGPASAVYGSGALTGVINVVTDVSDDAIGLSLGNFDSSALSAQLSRQVQGWELDLRVNMERLGSADYLSKPTAVNPSGEVLDPQHVADIDLSIRSDVSLLHFHYYHVHGENFYAFDTPPSAYHRNSFEALMFNGERRVDWRDVSTTFSLSLNRNMNKAKGLAEAGSGVLLGSADVPSREVALKMHNDWVVDEKTRWLLGAEWRHVDVPNSYSERYFAASLNEIDGVVAQGPASMRALIHEEVSDDNLGLYSQVKHEFSDSTELTVGLRYDNYQELNASQFSPRWALVYLINPSQSIKLLYGDAFRAPAPHERGVVNNSVLAGDSNLQPEKVSSWDVVWTGRHRKLSWSAGYFENHFKDAIFQVIRDGSAERHYVNGKQNAAKGVEVYWQWLPLPPLSLKGSSTRYLVLPEESYREARTFHSLSLVWTHRKVDISLAGTQRGTRYGVEEEGDGRRLFKAYTETQLNAAYRYNDRWRWSVKMSNVNDTDILHPGSGAQIPQGIPARGRELWLGLEWRL